MSTLHRHHTLRRQRLDQSARIVFSGSIVLSLIVLLILIFTIFRDAWPWLSWDFLTNFPSRFPDQSGIKSALWGTVWLAVLVSVICFPIGIAAAIYLEEYAQDNRVNRLLKINIANLAGVPSIIYGLLGLTVFVSWWGLGRSLLAGGLTMTLLILPLVILTAQEALRSVPQSYRLAAYALGASRWSVVKDIVLPSARPTIATGMILAIGRLIGEAAPMIMISALVYLTTVPKGVMDRFTILPIQIFNWISRPQADFHGLAAAAIIVLLIILLTLNGTAIYLRAKWQHQTEE